MQQVFEEMDLEDYAKYLPAFVLQVLSLTFVGANNMPFSSLFLVMRSVCDI